jgi:hypothetical protein
MKTNKINRGLIVLLVLLMVTKMSISVLASGSVNNENKFYMGKPVLTDSGFLGSDEIEKKDPHYGWSLGNFYLTGYTSKTDEGEIPVFLKTVGDTVSLYFNLEQDINSLNGNRDLVISEDKNGYDEGFQIKKTNFGKGTLIIRKTDFQNKTNKPQIYINYLSGIKSGADAKVDVYEEGDYEVALDYEIRNKKINPFGFTFYSKYKHYSIRYKFSVRNGNCMVFPFDTETREELTNKAITENGFFLDLAKSSYLDINIKKEVLDESSGRLKEDVRFNKPAKDGDQYTDNGIYTIKVKNKYTNEETVKKIYVGTNKVLKAYMTTGYSIRDIEDLIKVGATVDNSGNITIPKTVKKPDNFEEMSNSTVITKEAERRGLESNNKHTMAGNVIKGFQQYKYILPVILTVVVIVLIGILYNRISKRKKNERSNKELDNAEE